MKNGARHIELLDDLRGTAILAVLIFHSLGMAFGYDALPWQGWLRDFSGHTAFLPFLPVAMLAQAGVAIFFVVSGFCIHLSFETQGRRWSPFFVRRFFRIYPAYLLALVCSISILIINSRLDPSAWDFWKQVLAHVFLIHNFSPDTIYGFNAALWSLAVEAQLYLLYPLLLAIVGRRGWVRSLGLLAIIEVLIRAADGGMQMMDASNTVGGRLSWVLANSPLGYWFSWAIGAFIADAWLKKEPVPFARSSPALWLGLALGCYFVRPLSVFQFLLFAVATAVITGRILSKMQAGAAFPSPLPSTARGTKGEGRADLPPQTVPDAASTGPRPARAIPWSALQRIGLWSYSIYLLHQPLLHVYSHLIIWAVPVEYRPAPAAFFLVVATWLAIVPLSALWYVVVEIPGIALGKQISKSMIIGSPEAISPVAKQGTAARTRRGSAARYSFLALILAAGVAASLLVSYEFSVRAAMARSQQAWKLATDPVAQNRNGSLAVKLAEDACLQTQYRQPAMIGILAAAYAEAGRFDEAIGAAQMACKLASQTGDQKLLQQDEAMLKSFLQHQPFRESSSAGQ